MTAHRYVTKPDKLKAEFPAEAFYRAALRYVQALHVLYSSITDGSPDEYESGASHLSLALKVFGTKTTLNNVLDFLTNIMNWFLDKFGAKRLCSGKTSPTEEIK